MTSQSTLNNTVQDNNFSVNRSTAGTEVSSSAVHSDNTNAASNARSQLTTGGASGGDPVQTFTVTGVTSWSQGIDNTDSDSFKISLGTALGTSDFVSITTGGVLDFGSTENASFHKARVGAGVGLSLTNDDNTNSLSAARLTVAVGGGSAGDAYIMFDGSGSPQAYQMGYERDSSTFQLQVNPTNASPNMDGTTAIQVSNTGNVSLPAGNLSVSRNDAGSIPAISCSQLNAAEYSNIYADGVSPRTGYFSSGISDANEYWNFGMTNTGSAFAGGFALNFSGAGRPAPEGGTVVFAATRAGEITKPLQPAFLGVLTVDADNVTGNGAGYTLSTSGTGTLTEIFDQNNDFDPTTGVFTAPVTGRYRFECRFFCEDIDASMTSGNVNIATSNRTFSGGVLNIGSIRDVSNQCGMLKHSVLCDMDAADTASVNIAISGSGITVDVVSGNGNSFFSGNLVC
jgi:hypothetical protein